MTTKERLASGERILRSIDARRKSTKNPTDLLALEQAIVDRELSELDAEPMANEKVLLKPNRRRKKRRAVRRPPPEAWHPQRIPSSEREQAVEQVLDKRRKR